MGKKPGKDRSIEHVNRTSPDILAESVAQLRQLFPEAVAEGKIDFAKLRDALGDEVDDRPERYSFTWAGKRDAIRLLQTPSRATLVPAPKESVNFDSTHNVFIEGENLEVLKLLYRSYAGRVKMIYIDPPYNTGNDFIYPDNFADPLDTYLKLTGQKDSEGNLLTSNPETSGRYHSAWLTMMYPRLFVARQMLKEDGLIFVSIDDVEMPGLRLMMNELFGEDNFVATVVWKKTYGGGAKVKHVVDLHEYIVCYCRNNNVLGPIELPPDPEARRYYTEKDEKFRIRGPYRTQPLATTSMDERPNLRYPIRWKGEEIWPDKQWQWSQERVQKALKDNELVFSKQKGKWSVRYKQYLRDENGVERAAKPFSVLEGPYTQEGTAEVTGLLGDGKMFSFPKPPTLISGLLSYGWSDKDAIVVDFFAGSGTTAQAVLDLNHADGGNRRFILVQLPEMVPPDSAPAKGGFPTIADVTKERIRGVIKRFRDQAKGKLELKDRETPEDLGFRVFKLAQSHYQRWRGTDAKTGEALLAEMEKQVDPLLPGWKTMNVIYEVALKEGYSLTCGVEEVRGAAGNTVYRVTDADKDQCFLICLDDKLKAAAIKGLGLKKDDLFICRDVALTDEQAANLALQCKLKTI